MPEDMEMQARRLNDADSALRSGIHTYIDEGFSEEEIVEKVEELYAEATDG
jgi:response regulator RpfG family c-di-GMP phosphodiesterase